MSIIRADRVFENTTTVGSGAYSLGGALLAYQGFSNVCTVGDTFNYFAEAVDTSGVLTGAWETGTGTYASGNMITRTAIASSSNANAAVVWAAGTKRIALAMTSATLMALAGDAGSLALAKVTGSSSGTADAITVDLTPAIATLANGLLLFVRASGANTTTTPTFSPSGLQAYVIVKGSNLPLVAGDIAGSGYWLMLQFDAVLSKWVLLNPAKGSLSADAAADAIGAFRHGNILGTVSQSAGVPTGAVIERGYNANGEYVKFADGTLICNALLSGQAVSAGGITGVTWTFPATFAANPCVFFSPGAPTASEDVYGVARTYTINTASATFGYRNGATAQTINNIAACAIARWF